jgi:hypothetical protein
MKTCKKCNTEKSITDFYKDKNSKDGTTSSCKECRKSAERSYYHKHIDKRRILYKNRRLSRTNGEQLTLESYQTMLTVQENKCGICQDNMKTPYVDHNHITGNIRMLLCHHCNCLIGNAKESITILEDAIKYIKKFNS